MVDFNFNITEHLPWQHIFIVSVKNEPVGGLQNSWENEARARNQMISWCTENCKHQWFISEKSVESKLYAVPQVETTIKSGKYKAATINMTGFIIMFENEEEATAFKMMFYGE